MPFTIRDLPVLERPRERLSALGAHSLSLQELLEIVLSQGSSKESVFDIAHGLISKYQNLQQIESADIKDLCQVRGVGFAKAIQIKAALEIGKRFYQESTEPASNPILSSEHAFRLARNYLKNKKKEHLLLFCLDVRGRLIANPQVLSIGVLDCSLVHPREIFNSAVQKHSSKIMLAHNHPSGSPQPSDQDLEVTKQVYQAGLIMGVQLIDHIVLGENSYSSIRQASPEIFA